MNETSVYHTVKEKFKEIITGARDKSGKITSNTQKVIYKK